MLSLLVCLTFLICAYLVRLNGWILCPASQSLDPERLVDHKPSWRLISKPMASVVSVKLFLPIGMLILYTTFLLAGVRGIINEAVNSSRCRLTMRYWMCRLLASERALLSPGLLRGRNPEVRTRTDIDDRSHISYIFIHSGIRSMGVMCVLPVELPSAFFFLTPPNYLIVVWKFLIWLTYFPYELREVSHE